MDDINFFDNIDLKEVSKRTLIDLRELGYLKDEEFDKLSKTKGLGFIKIIEREYKVDLSDKREKFLEYLKENNKESNSELFIAPPKTSSKIFPKIFALSLIILIILGALYILYLNSLSSSSIVELKPEKNPIVQEAKKISGINMNKTDNQNTINKPIADEVKNENNTSNDRENKKIIIASDKDMIIHQNNETIIQKRDTIEQNLSNTVNEINNSMKNIDKQKSIQLSKKEKDNIAILSKSGMQNSQESNTTSSQVLTIVPKKRIWVGVINLSDYKKSSYIKDSNITIRKDSNFLIATGHGKFDIYFNDQVMKFDTVKPIRLLVKEGKVTKIDKKEFITLNRGKYW